MIKFRYVYSNGKEIKSFIYTIEILKRGKLNGFSTEEIQAELIDYRKKESINSKWIKIKKD